MAAPQPVAVATDVLLDFAVFFEHDRACDDVVEKFAIVADDDQRSRELDEFLLEHLERLDIQIIGRFVEYKEVRRAGQELCEDDAIAFAAR